MDHRSLLLITGILVFLIAATIAVALLRRRKDSTIDISIIDTCRSRIQAWWIFFGLLACALILGTVATTFFFFMLSFWALREYITLTPSKLADHLTLFLLYFIWTPLQFFLVGVNDEWFINVFGISSYQVYSVLIPVYAFLILPATIAVYNDTKNYLERVGKIQFGLVICVYSLSFAPALLTTTIPNERQSASVTPAIYEGGVETNILALPQVIEGTPAKEDSETEGEGPKVAQETDPAAEKTELAEVESVTIPEVLREKPMCKQMTSDHLCLLFFFIFIVQMSDIFQYLWSQFFRRGVIAESINKNKTWGGVFAGALSTSLLAMGLWYFVPLPKWWQPLIIGFVVSLMGFAGSITFSAIKRDKGVTEYGQLVEGHNGVLDRIDSLCFAAPVYFHLVWIFLHLEMRSF
jgi:predicted CDP-diglyceride synthetase/phosphatidate cytidylyltransferase